MLDDQIGDLDSATYSFSVLLHSLNPKKLLLNLKFSHTHLKN